MNPSNYDFRFRNLSVARKIRFIPFDYSKAGVYGPDKWKKLAVMDTELNLKFNNIVSNLESKTKE